MLLMVFILSVLGPGSFDRAIGTIAPTGRTMRRLSVQARPGRACTSDGSKGLPSSHRGFASPRLASAQPWELDRSRDARATKHAGKSEARSLSVIRLNHACFVGDGRSDMGYGMIVEGGKGQGAGGRALRQFKLKRGCRLQATGYRVAPSPICQIPSTFFRKAKMDRIQGRL